MPMTKTATCAKCGAQITLIKTGVTEYSYKWVTDPHKPNSTWKCHTTRDFPLRSHAPEEKAPA
jgi:hypothetical protein